MRVDVSFEDFLVNYSGYISSARSLGKGVFLDRKDFDSIFFMGMGGSGVVGDLVRDCFDFKVPVVCVKDFKGPSFLSSKSLVFVCSYSGKTRECVDFIRFAESKGACVVVLTCGGEVLSAASPSSKVVLTSYYSNVPSRVAIPLLFFPLVNVLSVNNLIEDVSADLDEVVYSLSSDVFSHKVDEFVDKLKSGFNVCFYSPVSLSSVGYVWKINFNETCKLSSFCNVFPESLHNEIEGFNGVSGDFYAFILNDSGSSKELTSRMDFFKKQVEGLGVPCSFVTMRGSCLLARVWSLIYLGCLTSFRLSVVLNRDPFVTDLIEEVNKEV